MSAMALKRIDPFSLAKVLAVIYGVLGLIIGCIIALMSLFGAALGAAFQDSDMAWIGPLFGVGAVILFPIFYAVLAFIMGLVVGALYNVAAGLSGGIRLELQ